MADASVVADYYDDKAPQYEAKYSVGYFTHVHTGIFDQATDAQLVDNIVRATPPIDTTRQWMFRGQERVTLRTLEMALEGGEVANVLDCGAGHGASAIYFAQAVGAHVQCLTASGVQGELIRQKSDLAGVGSLIDVEVCDVFEFVPSSEAFDVVLDIDAFCQMGRTGELLRILTPALRPNGRLVFSDNLLSGQGAQFKKELDDRWRCDVPTVAEFLEAASGVGLVPARLLDMTRSQEPFWKLSIAYSAAVMKTLDREDPEWARLADSSKFHRRLLAAFQSRDLLYYQGLLVQS